MARGIRWVLGAVVSLCCIGLLVWLGQTASNPSPEVAGGSAGGTMTNQDCARCHQDTWRQWSGSAHAASWTSPEVQAAFQHFGHDRKCESCHAPEPVVMVKSTEDVRLRQSDRDSGVNCLTCHALPGNRVAAARTIDDAPCRPLAESGLSASRMCGTCHTAIFDDWQASRYESSGKTCVACHMPKAAEGAESQHACPGSSDETLIRSGARMSCRKEDDQLVVEVTNHATGHNYPGERHHRVLSLEVLMHGNDDQIVLARREVIKDITPFRGESSSEQIAIDETYRAKFLIAPTATRAEIQLMYKRFPWQPDWKALIVHRQVMDLPAAP